MGDRTKIDWCDATINFLTGCLHGCEYCYARRIARRFCTNEHGMDESGVAHPCKGDCQFCSELDGLEFVGDKIRWNHNPSEPYPFGFWPTFHPHRLDIPARWQRPRNIFVCSMADLFGNWVPDDLIQKVFDACRKAPQHRYLFLTKNGERYMQLAEKGVLPEEDNFWFGTSVTTPESPFFWSDKVNTFASIEPILEPFDYKPTEQHNDKPKWIIVGAETGNRKNKVIPKKDWITGIIEGCREHHVSLFMKESLREIMGDDFIQEYPWGVTPNE